MLLRWTVIARGPAPTVEKWWYVYGVLRPTKVKAKSGRKLDAENAKQQAQQLMAEVRDTEYRQQMRLTVLKRREATVRKDELDATRLANLDEFDNTDWSTSLPEEDCEEILAGLSSLDQLTDSEQRYNLRSKGKSNTLPKTNKATQKQDKQKFPRRKSKVRLVNEEETRGNL